jgi:hypothetical protein
MPQRPNENSIQPGFTEGCCLGVLLRGSDCPYCVDPNNVERINEMRAQMPKVLKQGKTEIYLLGTIHGAHARNQFYSWPHLERILRQIMPDLLCVEIRPDHFKPEEFYSDGPMEMPFLVDLAQRSNCNYSS